MGPGRALRRAGAILTTRSFTLACRPLWTAPNPYPALLGESLQRQGVTLVEMGYDLGAYPKEADVVLLHWPDEFFVRRTRRQAIKAHILIALMRWQKARTGQKIVWVVHNIVPHDRDLRASPLARRFFFACLDGLIFLSNSSRDMLIDAFPGLRDLPFVVIPHGHYHARALSPRVPPPPLGARPARLAYLGQVRRYKAPDRLAEIVSAMPADEVSVAIAGDSPDVAFAEVMRRAGEGASNVSVDLRRLSDAELETHVDRADAVVLPYRDIVNSGSALYALSRDRPVMAPRLGSLIELQHQVGAEWLHLYDGDLDAETVRAFLGWLRTTPRGAAPDLSAHDWDGIGARVAAFLRAV